MVEVKEIKNQDEFNSFIEMDNDNIHVIKLGAEWCGPCKQLSNLIHNLDTEKIGNTLFAEVDIEGEDVDDILTMYKVRNIPVTLFIKSGELLTKKVGLFNKEEFYNIIETNL